VTAQTVLSTIVLVGCSAAKAAGPRPARDLYLSHMFFLARAYAERHGDQWFILSAQYGLVEPDERLEPYDRRLQDLDRADRREWGEVIADELGRRTQRGDRLIVLAGRSYVDPWRDLVGRTLALTVEEPLAGLGVGQRLHWLKAALAARRA